MIEQNGFALIAISMPLFVSKVYNLFCKQESAKKISFRNKYSSTWSLRDENTLAHT